ncbi:MAG: FAD-dependent oxidoreductase [Deltaproteobacteria bacterium]|nr:FAD-dependent oxidoreductase [Deltaproteobacteria bacterium]
MSRSLPRIIPWQGDTPQACHPFFYPYETEKISWPETAGGHSEVVVVGAGLSGLTAAYFLRHRDLMVLEAGEQVGGVCQSGNYRGVPYPAGSAYFYYPWEASWQEWHRELGLELDEALIAPPMSALFHEGRWHPNCFSEAGIRSLPVPRAGVDGLLKLAEDLINLENVWDLGIDTLPLPELDQVSLAHYLEVERGLPREVTMLLAPYCRSCLGAGPEAISAWAGLFFLMSEFSSGTRAVAFPEGNARLAQALSQALPNPPRCRHTLVGLRPRGEGVDLLVWNGAAPGFYRWEAGAVILAVGKFLARRLLTPDWGWRWEDFQLFRYSSYVVAALCGQITLEAPGYENWITKAAEISDFILAPRVPGKGPRVMVAFAPQPYPQGRKPLLQAQAEYQGRNLLAALEDHFPGIAAEVEEVRLYRFGHAQVLPYPGFLTFLRGRFPRKQGRIILAHSDLEGLPCIEAAIVQGQKAARRALAVLDQR